jgi:hypothetical protein
MLWLETEFGGIGPWVARRQAAGAGGLVFQRDLQAGIGFELGRLRQGMRDQAPLAAGDADR